MTRGLLCWGTYDVTWFLTFSSRNFSLFETSSLKLWKCSLFQKWISLATAGRNIKFKLKKEIIPLKINLIYTANPVPVMKTGIPWGHILTRKLCFNHRENLFLLQGSCSYCREPVFWTGGSLLYFVRDCSVFSKIDEIQHNHFLKQIGIIFLNHT